MYFKLRNLNFFLFICINFKCLHIYLRINFNIYLFTSNKLIKKFLSIIRKLKKLK